MGKTIAGAASGETEISAPKDSQSQAKGQERIMCSNAHSSLLDRDWGLSNLFLFLKNEVEKMERRRAVVSVIGKDQVGIISRVTTILANNNMNILDISQTILQDFFTMMMLIDVSTVENLNNLREELDVAAEEMGLKINIQLEEIFQAMHRI
jgi:ACT domain-containing protein